MTQWGLDTLFNPAKRHMDEEKRRLQSTREEVGDNSGGKRIDLESGKVSIKRVDPDDENPDENTAENDADAPAAKDERDGARDGTRGAARSSGKGGRSARSSSGATKGSGDGPSPAAIRAAQRRGRTAR